MQDSVWCELRGQALVIWFGLYIFHQVPCDDCPLQYEPIKDDQLYKVINNMIFFEDKNSHHELVLWLQVVMTEYVAGGGDGFKIIAENKEKHLQVRIQKYDW